MYFITKYKAVEKVEKNMIARLKIRSATAEWI